MSALMRTVWSSKASAFVARRGWVAWGAALVAAVTLSAGTAFADEHADDAHAAPAGEHADGEHAAEGGEHAGGHEHQDLNWFYGLLGETDDPEEESIWWRAHGKPVPLLALVLNTGLLFYGIYRFSRKGVGEALTARKQAIMQGINEASQMKQEASEQLAKYEQKLRSIDTEIERVRREMSAAADAERARILADAKSRQERMEREARELLEHEFKAMREELMMETARNAVKTAEQLLSERITEADHTRLEQRYLSDLATTLTAKGRA